MDDIPKSGRKSKCTPANVTAVRNVLNRDRKSTLRQITRDMSLSYSTARKIVKKKLLCKKHPSKWIPHLLTDREK